MDTDRKQPQPPPPTPWAWIKAARDIVQEQEAASVVHMPVQLLSWLYLSRLPEALEYDHMKQMGVTAVLTTNKIFRQEQIWEIMSSFAERDIRYEYVGGVDMVGYDMIKYHWEDAQTFLVKAKQADPHAKIVIHCAAGTNRSALIAGAAMLALDDTYAWTFLQVVRHLKQRRGRVLNNVWFLRLLAEFAQQCDRLGPRPDDDKYTNEPLRNSEMIC